VQLIDFAAGSGDCDGRWVAVESLPTRAIVAIARFAERTPDLAVIVQLVNVTPGGHDGDGRWIAV
jgi:hypothetical protein